MAEYPHVLICLYTPHFIFIAAFLRDVIITYQVYSQTISEANGKLPLSFLALSLPAAASEWLVRWISMIFPQPTNFKMSAFATDFPQVCLEISTPTRLPNLHKQIFLLLHFFFDLSLQTRPSGITYLTADVPFFMTQSFELMRNLKSQPI